MAKQKTIPELQAEIAVKKRQIAQLQHKQQQLENRRSYYRKGDRRKRAHHLITRGAAMESVAPLAKVLTETEFYAFAEKALALPEVKGLLMLSQTYEAEQKQLEAEAITLQQEIEVQERQNENIEKFIQKAHKYVGIEELDGYALRELVSAIYVDAPDKSSGKRVQHIHIKYDGLGFIPLNELMKKGRRDRRHAAP